VLCTTAGRRRYGRSLEFPKKGEGRGKGKKGKPSYPWEEKVKKKGRREEKAKLSCSDDGKKKETALPAAVRKKIGGGEK